MENLQGNKMTEVSDASFGRLPPRFSIPPPLRLDTVRLNVYRSLQSLDGTHVSLCVDQYNYDQDANKM